MIRRLTILLSSVLTLQTAIGQTPPANRLLTLLCESEFACDSPLTERLGITRKP